MTALLGAVLLAAPLSAQVRRPPPPPPPVPKVALRPFFLLTAERFFAVDAFDAVFGRPLQSLWGGGLEVAWRNGLYVDVAVSRFHKKGQRAFFFNGQGFGLGIPLTATLTPLEATAGRRMRVTPRVFAYVGGGLGSYAYSETSQFSDSGDAVEARHLGYLGVVGAEYRPKRSFGVSGDIQVTRVPGILGEQGLSKETGERDLGGVAVRFRVILGR